MYFEFLNSNLNLNGFFKIRKMDLKNSQSMILKIREMFKITCACDFILLTSAEDYILAVTLPHGGQVKD